MYWEKEKKREKRERSKEKRKRKKRKKKTKKKVEKEEEIERKEKKGGWGKETNQKAKQNKTKKKEKKRTTGEYLLILCTLSPLASPGTCPSSWSSGGGACCADSQVLAVGGAAVPLPGAGLSGGCLPREAAGGTAPVAGQLWKPGFSSGRNSVCRAWRLRGGAADVLSWGRSVLAVLGPPGLCLSRGRPDPGLCPGALCSGACTVGFALPPRSPLR